ncbi:hypothetical protein J6590_082154 [Homalodisca vitripennis]|nr:hypothetical protein J6590_082154 [Homalodisca vitripennis]
MYLLCGTRENRDIASIKKKEYGLLLKNIRKSQNADFINGAENKSKAIWEVINSEKQSKHPKYEPIQLKIDNRVTGDPQKVADDLNCYFINATTNILAQIPNNCRSQI